MHHYLKPIRLDLYNKLMKTWIPYCVSRYPASNTVLCLHPPSRTGHMKDQTVFASKILSLFSLGQHLSVSVKKSEVMHRFLSEVFNFKT